MLQRAAASELFLIAVAAGLIGGWIIAYIYFRQRIWVMEHRLSEYAERRMMILTANTPRCPKCNSRRLHRSKKRNITVYCHMLCGLTPYRCGRCYAISFFRKSEYLQSRIIDTYENYVKERARFQAELRIARKMRRLYPEMFEDLRTLQALSAAQAPRTS